MNLKLCGSVLLIGLAVEGCRNDATKVVTLEEWFSIEQAKSACKFAISWHKENQGLIDQVGCGSVAACPEMMPQVTECTSNDPEQQARQFSTVIASEFRTLAACNGIALSRDRALANKNYWSLFVFFEPGNPKQDWKIEHREIPLSFEGTGTAREMVQKLCTAVSGKGGKVEQ
jgi:hypothetical protein